MLELISEPLSTDPIDRDEKDAMLIELSLTLIRNLCCIENTHSTTVGSQYVYNYVSFSLHLHRRSTNAL